MKSLVKSALIRGLFWQILLWVVGMVLFALIQLAVGVKPQGTYFFSEPAWVFGAFLGMFGYLGGSGVMTDWFQWARGIPTPEHRPDPPTWWKYFNISLDHKVIGIQYTVTSLFLLAVGGIFALIFRTELAEPGLQFLTLQQYNTLMSLHGILMIVGILVGVAGVMNYVVPMIIGAHDMDVHPNRFASGKPLQMHYQCPGQCGEIQGRASSRRATRAPVRLERLATRSRTLRPCRPPLHPRSGRRGGG